MMIELTPEMASLLLEARRHNKEFLSRRSRRIHLREENMELMSRGDKALLKTNFDRDKPEIASWGRWKKAEQELGELMFSIPVKDEELKEVVDANKNQCENSQIADEE